MLLEESESESFSDDSESDKMSKSWDALSEDSMISQDSSLPGKEILGQIYLQYVEYGSPYKRMPLVDKVKICALLILVVSPLIPLRQVATGLCLTHLTIGIHFF